MMESKSLQLKHASFAGDFDALRQLLNAGADPNATDRSLIYLMLMRMEKN